MLSVIADHCGSGESAYPGEERIARRLGVGIRTVKRGVRELRTTGLLEVKRRPGNIWGSRSNMYFVNRAAIENQTNSTGLTDPMGETQRVSQSNSTGLTDPMSETQRASQSNSTGLTVQLNGTHRPDNLLGNLSGKPKEEEDTPPAPQSQEVLVSIPCLPRAKGQSTPETWPLTPEHRDWLETLHPGVSAVETARKMVRKIEKGTWNLDTPRETPKRLAAWMAKETERREAKQPGMAPGPPADPTEWVCDSVRKDDLYRFGGGNGQPAHRGWWAYHKRSADLDERTIEKFESSPESKGRIFHIREVAHPRKFRPVPEAHRKPRRSVKFRPRVVTPSNKPNFELNEGNRSCHQNSQNSPH